MSGPCFCRLTFLLVFHLTILYPSFPSASASSADFSIIEHDAASDLFQRDYFPPTPPPPPSPPHPPPASCEDLKGIGSINTTCQLNYSLNFTSDIYIPGDGNLFILQGVVLACPSSGCSIVVNITGEFKLNPSAEIVAGSVYIVAGNATLFTGSVINSTALGGEPTIITGTPSEAEGGGGGYGGRGASCVMDNKKLPEDVWGGDAYGWDSLMEPWSYGSKGDTTSKEDDYGGKGGGRIWIQVKDSVDVSGVLLSDGGDGGTKGGGGSGGSIYVKTRKM